MKLKLETKQVIETTINLPAFYRSKSGIDIIGIFSEEDYRELNLIGDTIFIKMTGCDINWPKIQTAFLEFETISEVEFMEAWDAALEKLSLTPTLKTN